MLKWTIVQEVNKWMKYVQRSEEVDGNTRSEEEEVDEVNSTSEEVDNERC
jgi:hypothetical protein